jgi:hypothetical protein
MILLSILLLSIFLFLRPKREPFDTRGCLEYLREEHWHRAWADKTLENILRDHN